MEWADPVVEHIPEYSFGGPLRTRATTLHDLVTHRAGLPNVIGGLFNQDIGIDDLLEALPTREPVTGLREEALYSQVGVALPGEVVARVSGMSWPDFVRSRILEPLEMADTRVGTLASMWKPVAIEGSVFAPMINPFSDLTAYCGGYAYDRDRGASRFEPFQVSSGMGAGRRGGGAEYRTNRRLRP